MLTVYNAGDGDSFAINPVDGCSFAKTPLVIDFGPANKRVYRRIAFPVFDAVVTHSDNDHIGGLRQVLMHKTILNLYLPYYLLEVIAISSYLRKYAKPNFPLSRIRGILPQQIRLIGEGDAICTHCRVLNPPKPSSDHFTSRLDLPDIDTALSILEKKKVFLPRKQILEYVSPAPTLCANNPLGYQEASKDFVHLFFRHLAKRIELLRGAAVSSVIKRSVNESKNSISVVLKYVHNSEKVLMTGDADISVFERLIASGCDISASILKVPHHGSVKNYSAKIHSQIMPDHAVISHNNRKYGSSPDGHPNIGTLNILKAHGTEIHCTNSVQKNPEYHPLIVAATGPCANGAVVFA